MTPHNSKRPLRAYLFPPLVIGFLAYVVAYSPWADKYLGTTAAARPPEVTLAEPVADTGAQLFLVSRPAGAKLFAGADRKPIGKAPQALANAKAGHPLQITARFADGAEVTRTVTPAGSVVAAIFLRSEAKPANAEEGIIEQAVASEESDTEEDQPIAEKPPVTKPVATAPKRIAKKKRRIRRPPKKRKKTKAAAPTREGTIDPFQ